MHATRKVGVRFEDKIICIPFYLRSIMPYFIFILLSSKIIYELPCDSYVALAIRQVGISEETSRRYWWQYPGAQDLTVGFKYLWIDLLHIIQDSAKDPWPKTGTASVLRRYDDADIS
jgi:hypothetical protein